MQKKQFHEFFPRTVGMAGKAIRRRLNHNLARAGYDLMAEHAVVMANLHGREGLTQQEISEIICRHKASTTRLLDFLEKRNLIRRVSSTADRRQKMIYLTTNGKRLLRKLRLVAEVTQNEALKGINPKEVQICKDVLWQAWQNLAESPLIDKERSST